MIPENTDTPLRADCPSAPCSPSSLTPETDEAWKAVSRTPDGMYDSSVPISAFAYAMYDHSKKMERQRDAAVMLAGELVAIIRVNAMRGTWAAASAEEVDEFLVPWIAKLRLAQGHSPENAKENPMP